MLPADVVAQYFELLNRTRNLRKFLAERTGCSRGKSERPERGGEAFYYYQQQGNLPQAHRALIEYRMRRAQPTPDELLALATLFEQTNNFAEAAQELSTFSRAQAPQAEAGLCRVDPILVHGARAACPDRWRRHQFLSEISRRWTRIRNVERHSVAAVQLDGPAVALFGAGTGGCSILPST